MDKRKTISKKTRFEVFKRDKFTCQYCGKMAPDVILEVDHIKPVAEGGTNDIMNLVTACRDCNRGKGKTQLSDESELKKQQAQLADLAERREQAKMMIEWRSELTDICVMQAKSINDYIATISDWECSDTGIANLVKLIRRFSYTEVYDATEIAFNYYYRGTDDSWQLAFGKIGGICYNRRKQREMSENDGNI